MNNSVSIIIPSFNGADRLLLVIEALKHQTVIPNEIIVVVDGSTDSTIEVLKSVKSNFNLKWVYQANAGRSITRNNGAAIATSQYLLFIDDDIELIPESVALHLDAIQKHPNSIISGIVEECHLKSNEYTAFKGYISGFWFKHLKQTLSVLSESDLFLSAANMLISKETFNKLNGFAPELSDAEDYDLAVRAYCEGIQIIYSPHNIGYHFSFSSFKQYIYRQREYVDATKRLLELRTNSKCHNLYWKYHIEKSVLKSILYACIPTRIIYWMDEGKFHFLPSALRFALYSRVISAFSVYHPKRLL